jgi:hypothetical protein
MLEATPGCCQLSDRHVIIHLRGVYDANIEVLSLQKKKYGHLPILEQTGVKGGSVTTITIPASELPGQFVLQFKYRQKETDYPYPAPRNIYVGSQDVEMWTNPIFGNNPDSTWFSSEEQENNRYAEFQKENALRRPKVNLLQLFLMQYDETDSKMYKTALKEYDNRRTAYNNWISESSKRCSSLYVGMLFQFQHIPDIAFRGTEKERTQSLISHFFEGISMKDEALAGTKELNDWVTMYVNLNNGLYTNKPQADTMLVKAAKRLVEHAKNEAHPKVYGFLVDYFFNGFEGYNMMEGVKMLQPFSADPKCMTSKRIEIERRIAGLATLKARSPAPEVALKDSAGIPFSLHAYRGSAPRKLLLFWSADCQHCMEMVKKLKSWHDSGKQQMVDIIAVSVDDTNTEVDKWKKTVKELPGWLHLRAEGGINSKVAYDYAILATPYLYLISSGKNTIIGVPDDVQQLNAMMSDPY